jgi:hypothetical protein
MVATTHSWHQINPLTYEVSWEHKTCFRIFHHLTVVSTPFESLLSLRRVPLPLPSLRSPILGLIIPTSRSRRVHHRLRCRPHPRPNQPERGLCWRDRDAPPQSPRQRPHVVSVRPSAKTTFRLRIDAGKTLILMFCAGTALAPFRGFLQQRAIQMRVDWKLVRAVLFVGCRLETKDRLHAEQIDK